MNYRCLFLFTILLSLLAACSKPLPNLEKIDLEKWKEDKWGCSRNRLATLPELASQKEKLKGLSQDDIVNLLGRPDKNELYKRNQKFFYYYLTPGANCGRDTITQRLSLRFNAMGFAKEVLVE